MSSDQINVIPVSFGEHSAVKPSRASSNDFDIVIVGEFSLSDYCTALIEKAFSIHQSAFPKFVDHHCSLVKDPFTWLNRFEKLLAENEDLFFEKKKHCRFTKLYLLIADKRKETQKVEGANSSLINLDSTVNGRTLNRIYCFEKTKAIADKMATFEEKFFLLEEQITIYRQYPPHIINHNIPDFAEQCQFEIDMLVRQEKFRREFTLQNTHTPVAIKKFPVNLETKSFVHVFYLLMQKTGDYGKPVLPYSVADIAEHICSHYCHMDGTPFKLNTVRTYLTKGKPDSRPKGNKEIGLDLGNI